MNELSPKTQMNIQKWLDIIHCCRDSGLSNRQWCEENDVELKSYYYWLSKIRKLAIENITRKPHASSVTASTAVIPSQTTFAEISIEKKLSHKADAIAIHIGNAFIEIPVDAPDSLIQSVILAVSKC